MWFKSKASRCRSRGKRSKKPTLRQYLIESIVKALPFLTTEQLGQLAQLVTTLAVRNHLPTYQPPQQQSMGPPLAGDQPPSMFRMVRQESLTMNRLPKCEVCRCTIDHGQETFTK